ncbi:MAG: 3-methyl-2-oxobutanoate hydroxymethyltransferase [Aestuariivirga sp.]
MTRKRPTVADVRAMKGKYQYTMLRVETMEELEAAELAGIDMVSVPPDLMCDPEFRDAAPGLFAVPGLNYFDVGTTDDFIRWAFRMVKASADAVYCSASLQTVRRLSEEAVPVIGHVGLVPSKRTWTGGFKAVGKSAESAMQVFDAVRQYESAGAFGAEIEVVPSEVAAEISKRTPLFMVSMGAGTGCDAQYLFAEDVLGSNTGHYPRHAKRYRDFAAENARLQRERIAAFSEFSGDVKAGTYPEANHEVAITPDEMRSFRKMLASTRS